MQKQIEPVHQFKSVNRQFYWNYLASVLCEKLMDILQPIGIKYSPCVWYKWVIVHNEVSWQTEENNVQGGGEHNFVSIDALRQSLLLETTLCFCQQPWNCWYVVGSSVQHQRHLTLTQRVREKSIFTVRKCKQWGTTRVAPHNGCLSCVE